jgi:hypothetical protein
MTMLKVVIVSWLAAEMFSDIGVRRTSLKADEGSESEDHDANAREPDRVPTVAVIAIFWSGLNLLFKEELSMDTRGMTLVVAATVVFALAESPKGFVANTTNR